ncbi:HNH endonuclease [Methylobacterium sp. CM6244]
MGRWDQFTGGRYIKICATKESELLKWLLARGLKNFSKYCSRCKPPRTSWSTAEVSNPHPADKPPAAETTQERRRIIREIEARQGAPAFRSALIRAYQGRCAATGCNAHEALEAAHIQAYSHDGSNATSNGLLLRADIHTLFDLGLLGVDEDRKWIVSASLRGSEYERLQGKSLREAVRLTDRADAQALKWHRQRSKLSNVFHATK